MWRSIPQEMRWSSIDVYKRQGEICEVDIMDIKKCTGLAGEPRDYYLYPKAEPPYEQSDYIEEVLLDRFRYHSGEGDMWRCV